MAEVSSRGALVSVVVVGEVFFVMTKKTRGVVVNAG